MSTVHLHHIIPKHMGGTDEPNNLKKVSIEEHAELHKELYEQYGRWQDKLAWQGLAGIITNQEAIQQSIIGGAKMGAKRSNELQGSKRKYTMSGKPRKKMIRDQLGSKNPNAKRYEITCPNGETIITECLSSFCEENNLKLKTLHKAYQRGSTTQTGHSIKLQDGGKIS